MHGSLFIVYIFITLIIGYCEAKFTVRVANALSKCDGQCATSPDKELIPRDQCPKCEQCEVCGDCEECEVCELCELCTECEVCRQCPRCDGCPACDCGTHSRKCPIREGPHAPEATDRDPFSPMTGSEYQAAIGILERSTFDLTISSYSMYDNSILHVEMWYPPKAETLAFRSGSGPAPDRYARAYVARGGIPDPDVAVFKVGPLGSSSAEAVLVETASWRMRQLATAERRAADSVLTDQFTSTRVGGRSILSALFKRGEVNGISASKSSEVYIAESVNRRRVKYKWIVAGSVTSVMLPLFVVIDVEDKAPSKWNVVTIWFNGQRFQTAEELAVEVEAGRVQPYQVPAGWSVPEAQLTRDTSVEAPIGEDRSPPKYFLPEGARFSVEDNGQKISYLGWEFGVGFSSKSGIIVYDAKFKGTPIAYEIAVQEAYVAYSGVLGADHRFLFDSSLGSHTWAVRQPARGYDCPETSQYLDIVTYSTSSSHHKTLTDAICVFEFREQIPHRSHGGRYATAGTSLIVRQFTTVGNYDYVFDFKFFPSGRMDVTPHASGYLLSDAWFESYEDQDGKIITPKNFGNQIAITTNGQYHTHIFPWKVDLDFMGPKNSLAITKIVGEKFRSAIEPDEVIGGVRLKTSIVENEGPDAHLLYDQRKPEAWKVVKEGEENKYGDDKAYKIIMNTPSVEVRDSVPYGRTWQQYNVIATRHHDDEYTNVWLYDQIALTEQNPPHVNFAEFSNGESLRDQDLVFWISTAWHHIPRLEDFPITPMTSASGFTIEPFGVGYDETNSFTQTNTNGATPSAPEECIPNPNAT